MKKLTPRRLGVIVLILVLLGSVGALGWQLLQYRAGGEAYREAEELVQLPDLGRIADTPSEGNTPDTSQTPDISEPSADGQQTEEPAPPAGSAGPVSPAEPGASAGVSSAVEEKPVYVDPYAEALRSMDFAALREKNQDVLGWILIPGTDISYPLVQGEDNEYYLNHTWRKTKNVVGAIFMECRCSPDLGDFNTIIYGHRMNNMTMFAKLLNYKDQSYLEKHPRIYITDDGGTHVYEIFASYEAPVNAATYRIGIRSEADKQTFINYCLTQSVVETGVVPTVQDRIVTLSTCTGNGHATRWVVQGVEVTAAGG